MTDLATLSVPTPRPAPIVRRYARRVEPAAGFVRHGVVAAIGSLLSMGAGIGVAMAVWLAFDLGAGSGEGAALVWAGMIAGGLVPWLVFARSVRRRREGAARLVRDGVLVEGCLVARADDARVQAAVEAVAAQLGGGLGPWESRVEVEHGGGRCHLRCPFPPSARPAARVAVLLCPGYPHALAFDAAGAAIVASVHAD